MVSIEIDSHVVIDVNVDHISVEGDVVDCVKIVNGVLRRMGRFVVFF